MRQSAGGTPDQPPAYYGSQFGLQVDMLQEESFKKILGAALQAILRREAISLHSMRPLLQELPRYTVGSSQTGAAFTCQLSVSSHFKRTLKPLCTPPYRSFYALPIHEGGLERFHIVAPDMKMELDRGQWYEHGALREWHERRRRKIWSSTPEVQQHIDEYETTNQQIRPSYLPPLTDLNGATGSCFLSDGQHTIDPDPSSIMGSHENTTGQKRKYSDQRQDDPQNPTHCSSNKRQRLVDPETPNLAQDSPHCSLSGKILPDPGEMTTDIGSRVGTNLEFDWAETSPGYQQTNPYDRIWE